MFRICWGVEPDANGLVEVTEKDRRRGRLGPRVCHVQMCANFTHDESSKSNLLMNVVGGHSNMLDTCGYCVGLENINARLAVTINWSRVDMIT